MVKRIFQGVIVFFAIYSFVFVPLGKKTALEHVRAIFGTPAAREAAAEVKGGVTRLVRRLEREARQSTEKTDQRLQEREPDEQDDTPPADDAQPADEAQPAGASQPSDEARAAEVATPPRKRRQRALSAEAPAPPQR
jgi:hypothetical protein